ncbi:hypothetical protein D9611_002735 [Ephemerocybe angulata]|uniref:Uncharacterized protein n=2 Tax=Ephemerocybe angulata TaxID=980116 RepID=A0A8H5FDR3_9AGAR|nr:hypothetical protein D9611_002735 [Tulosesus angulatus]KAF6761985.1 hypothetical protein DFP72DRAFT_1061268 [Tulosesus angulatus]
MGILTPLYNRPNYVVEKQKMYQNSPQPLILRGPRAKLYVGTYAAIFSVGMVLTTVGSWQLIKGKDA